MSPFRAPFRAHLGALFGHFWVTFRGLGKLEKIAALLGENLVFEVLWGVPISHFSSVFLTPDCSSCLKRIFAVFLSIYWGPGCPNYSILGLRLGSNLIQIGVI